MKKLILTLVFCLFYFSAWADCPEPCITLTTTSVLATTTTIATTTTTTSIPTTTTSIIPTTTTTSIATTTTTINLNVLPLIPTAEPIVDVVVSGNNALGLSSAFGQYASNSLSPLNTVRGTFSAVKAAIAGTTAVVIGKHRHPADGIETAMLTVWDISDPAKPVLQGKLNTTIVWNPSSFLGFFKVAVNSTGTMAVIAGGSAGVHVIDLTNKALPVIKYTYDTPGIAYSACLSVDGTKAYVADGSPGIKVLSVSLTTAPALLGSKVMTGHIMRDIAISGNYVYAANQQGTLDSFDIATPANIIIKGVASTSGLCKDVAVFGNTAAVISRLSTSDVLDVYNVTNPAAMTRKGTAATISAANATQGFYMNSESSVYLACSTEGLKVFTIP